MKYVNIHIGFNSGIKENYRLEIEPHEVDAMKKELKHITSVVYDSYSANNNNTRISFRSIRGLELIRVSSIDSFCIEDLEFL